LARYLALDWDQNQLHVIAADVRGGAVTVQRAAVWPESRFPTVAEAQQLGQALRDRLREAGITAAPVLACVGRDRTVLKEVRFPAVPPAEEPTVVRFQVVKELSDSPEDSVIDYVPDEAAGGERQALVLVVKKELLAAYQAVCQAAGLKLAALTPRAFGLAACISRVMGTSVLTPAPEPADAAVAVVCIGERWAEFCVCKAGRVLRSRALPVNAELAADVRRNLAVHAGQSPHDPIRAVYVAGQGVADVRQRLVDLIELPVHAYDPFAGAELPELPPALRGTFAGAAGLLFSQAGAGLPVNFVQPRQPKPPVNPRYRLIRLGLTAAAALLVALTVLGRLHLDRQEAELANVEGEVEAVKIQLDEAVAKDRKLKAIDDWDTAVWLDDLYNLTAYIPDVDALRITSLTADTLSRSAKSRFAGTLLLKGKLLSRNEPRRALDQLVEELNASGYYSPEAPKVEKDTFTLRIKVERRGPADQKEAVSAPAPKGEGR
jgi:hypothetical protein